MTRHRHRRMQRSMRQRLLFRLAAAAASLVLLFTPSTLGFSPSRRPPSTRIRRYADILDPIAAAAEVAKEENPPQRQQQPQWITCSSSKEISHAIRSLVGPDDRVAELGSQLREVSTAICETSASAVLVDTLRKFPKDAPGNTQRTQAMRMEGDEEHFFPDRSRFHEIERLDDWRQALFSSNAQKYDVFVLDVNSIVGNDLEFTTLSLIREFLALNAGSCRLVLVKSLSLNQWASRLIHGQRWCRQGGFTELQLSKQQNSMQKICQVVATVGVPEYRETIPHTVRPGDAVLEVGCHLGTSTALIHEAATAANGGNDGPRGYCIGVDIGTKIIQGAQKRHKHIFFEVGDAWRTASLLRTQQDFLSNQKEEEGINQRIGFDVVYVDVGGLSGQDGIIESLSLLSAISNALEPRCIVIKSLCMRRLSSTLAPYWKMQKRSIS